MRARSLALPIVAFTCAFPPLALAQSTPPAPIADLTTRTISQTEIDLSWNANTTPTPPFPGTAVVFFANAASSIAARVQLTGQGVVTGTDVATGTTYNAVTFDTGIDFGPGESTITESATGQGRMSGSGALQGVGGSAQGAVKASFAPLFPRLAALVPVTTHKGGLQIANNSITTGGPLLVEGPFAISGNGDVGSPSNYMIVIVRPTSASQLPNLVSLSGKGSFFGALIVDLSLLNGNPLALSGPLLSITGSGSLNGIFAVNGPKCPLAVTSPMITGFTGQGGFLGGAVLEINGSLVNAQGTSSPPGSLPLVNVTGKGSVQYDSSTIAAAYKVVVAASAPSSFLVERSLQSGGPYVQVGTSTSTSFADTGLASGTTYYYVIQAENAAGVSPRSSEVSATTLAYPPTNVAATTVSQTELDLSWTPAFGATSYAVSRGTQSGGPYTPVAVTTAASLQDMGLASGTAYYYVVQSIDAGGASGFSSEAHATTLAYPPTNVAATPVSQSQIAVTWSGAFGATSYVVLRGTSTGGPYAQVSTPSGTTFQDTGLASGTTYYYVVRSVDAGGTSGNSNEAQATTPPAPPASVAATAVSQTEIDLTWTPSFGATGYLVFRGSRSGGPYSQVGSAVSTSFHDTGLAAGTTYYYVVQASDAGGVSGNSAQASATTFPNPPVMAVLMPADGSVTNDTLPEIKITYSGTNLQFATLEAGIDGSTSALRAVAATTTAALFIPTQPLGEGQHTIQASITDGFGSKTSITSGFAIELTATHLGLSIAPSDPQSVLVNSLNSLIVTALTDHNLVATGFTGPIQATTTAGQATLDQLLAQFTVANQGVLTIPNVAIVLQPGLQTVTAVALASPSIQGTLTLNGVTSEPTVTPTTVNANGSTTLTINTIPFGSFTVLVNGTVYATGQASASGTFTLTLVLPPGVNSVEVTTPTAGDSTILQLGPPQTVSGLVRGGPLGADQPLPGVPVTIEGAGLSTVTAADGSFSIPNVPIGNQVVNVNASFVSSSGNQFSDERIGVSVAGTPVFLGAIVLRPVVYAPGAAAPIGFSGASAPVGVLRATNPNLPFVSATVGPGTLTVPSGVQPFVTVSAVSMVDLPIRLPPGLASSQFISVGPEGATIDGPLTLTFPNADGVPPNGTTPLWHYSPTLGAWVIAGIAKADNFGTTLTTDPQEFGIYATQAHNAVQTDLPLAVVDESFGLVNSDPLTLQVFGSSVTGLTFLPLGPVPSSATIVPTAAQFELVFTVPSLPYTAALRVTRSFPDGASATAVVTVNLPQPSVTVRLGHPANLSGTVVANHNQIVVENATVSAGGVTATTDQYGNFTLNNVEIYSTLPPYNDKVDVSATKFVGKTFTGSPATVQASDAAKASYPSAFPVPTITIDADVSQGPLFTATTIAQHFTPDAYGFTSLVYEPELRHFYTENVTTNQIWQADASGFVPAVDVPIAFGPAGLQRGTLSMGTSLVGAGGLWVADGHKGTVYSVFPSNPGPPLAAVQVAADNLNTLWAQGIATTPLVDHFEDQLVAGSDHDSFGLGAALVLFRTTTTPNGPNGAQWYRVFPQVTTDLTAYWNPYMSQAPAKAAGFGQLYVDNVNGGYSLTAPGGILHIANPSFIYGSSSDPGLVALTSNGLYGYLFLVGPKDQVFGSGVVAVTGPNGPIAIMTPTALGAPTTPPSGQISTIYSTNDLVKTQSYPQGVDNPLSLGHLYNPSSPPPPFFLADNFGVISIPRETQFILTQFSPPVPGPNSGPFTPTALAFANALNDTTLLAITNDAKVQGLGSGNCGTSVVAQSIATGKNLTIYTAPPGFALTGMALAPDPSNNQSSIFVLQTNQQAVVTNGGQSVEYDMVEIRPADALYFIWNDVPFACPNGATSTDFVANNFLLSLGVTPCNADPFGDGLGPYVHVVNTGILGRIPPPEVVRVYPQPGSVGNYIDTPLYMDFNQGMRTDTLNANFTLTPAGGPSITGTFTEILGTPNRAIFTVSGQPLNLAPVTTYTAVLVGGPGGAQELLGRFLAQTFTWTFTTGSDSAAAIKDPLSGVLDIEAEYYGLDRAHNGSYPNYPGTNVPIAIALCGLHDPGVAGTPSAPGGKGNPGGSPPDNPNPVTETPPLPNPDPTIGTLSVIGFYPVPGSVDNSVFVTPSVLFNGPVNPSDLGKTISIKVMAFGEPANLVPVVDSINPALVDLVPPQGTPVPVLSSGVLYDTQVMPIGGVAFTGSDGTFTTTNTPTTVSPPNETPQVHQATTTGTEIHPLVESVAVGGDFCCCCCRPSCCCCCDCAHAGALWVNPATGSVEMTAADANIPARSPPVVIMRTYRGNIAFHDATGVTTFGPNWNFNYDRRFVATASGANGVSLNFVTEDGRDYACVASATLAVGVTGFGGASTWDPYPGFHEDVHVVPANSFSPVPLLVQRLKVGGKRYYYYPVPQNPGDVARLVRVEDTNEEVLLLARDGAGRLLTITDSLNRQTSFVYYTASDGAQRAGKLKSVTDYATRTWLFDYTSAGELAQVQTPASDVYDFDTNGNLVGPSTQPKITDYTYNDHPLGATNPAFHHLLSTIHTRGLESFSGVAPTLPAVRIFYSPLTARVTQVDHGKGSEFHDIDFTVDAKTNQYKTTHIDREGAVLQTFFDASPRGSATSMHLNSRVLYSKQLRVQRGIDPNESTFYQTQYKYDRNHELAELTRPNQSVERWIRDDSPGTNTGTLLQHVTRTFPGDPNTQPSIVDMEYEATFNLLRRETEPRGNTDVTAMEQIGTATASAVPAKFGSGVPRDTFTSYFFYDHEDVLSIVAGLQSPTDPSLKPLFPWTAQPLLQSWGRAPNANQPLASVFRDKDGDGLLDRGGNVYLVRGPRPQQIANSSPWSPNTGSTWAFTGYQDIQTRYNYNSFGQNILMIMPNNMRMRMQWNTNSFDLTQQPDAGYQILDEYATSFTDADLDYTTGAPLPGATGSFSPSLNLQWKYHSTPWGARNQTTDPNGNKYTQVINAMGLVVSETGPAPFGYFTNHFYDSRGNRVQDRIANIVPIDRDDNGIQDDATEQQNLGFFTNTFHYDELNDLVVSDLDATGSPSPRLLTIFQYDLKQRRVAVEQGEGNVHKTIFDERDLVVESVAGASDPLTQQAFRFAVDLNGNTVTFFNDDGATASTSTFSRRQVDGLDRTTSLIDELGNHTDFVLDAAGNAIQLSRFGQRTGISGEAVTTLLARAYRQIDEAGREYRMDVEFFKFDASGNPVAVPVTGPRLTAPTPASFTGTTYTDVKSLHVFDPMSMLMDVVNDRGEDTHFDYDAANRRFRTTDNLGTIVEDTLDNNGLATRTTTTEVPTDGSGNKVFHTERFFDAEDRLVQRVSELGNTTRWLYDSRSNVTQTSDAQAMPSAQALGSLRPSAPNNGVVLNRRGNTVRFQYDGASRPLETDRDLRQDGTGDTVVVKTIVTKNQFDRNSRVVKQTDDNQNVTEYCYDDQNRLIMTHYANGTRRDLVWVDNQTGANNRLSTLKLDTDARGIVKVYSYDPAKRRTGMKLNDDGTGSFVRPPGDPSVQTTSETWQWDGLCRMTLAKSFTDRATAATLVLRQYDSMGNALLQQQDVATASGPLSLTVQDQFDSVGNPTLTSYPVMTGSGGSSALTLRQLFDGDDRLGEIDDWNASTSTPNAVLAHYEHIGMGARVLTRSLPQSGVTLTRSYDGERRVQTHTHTDKNGNPLKAFQYVWDRVGNRRSESDTTLGKGNFYVYDSAYRLTTDLRSVPSGSLPTYNNTAFENQSNLGLPTGGAETDYALDGANNRQAVTTASGTTGYTLNTFKSWTPSSVLEIPPAGAILADSDMNQYSQVGGASLTYDLAGNQISSAETGEQRYFDCYDRLVQTVNTSTGKDARYRYDALGRRLSKAIYSVSSPGGPPTQEIVYARDGWETLEEWDPAATSATKRFVYGEHVDEPLRMTVSGNDYWYLDNSIGSVAALTDKSGNLVEQYTYKAYGELDHIVDGSSLPITDKAKLVGNPFLFQGRRLDFEEASSTVGAGLYYYRARYYDPALGRFVSRDSREGVWGDTQSLGNAQCAFGNNPINRRDPFGHSPDDEDLEEIFGRAEDLERLTEEARTNAGNNWLPLPQGPASPGFAWMPRGSSFLTDPFNRDTVPSWEDYWVEVPTTQETCPAPKMLDLEKEAEETGNEVEAALIRAGKLPKQIPAHDLIPAVPAPATQPTLPRRPPGEDAQPGDSDFVGPIEGPITRLPPDPLISSGGGSGDRPGPKEWPEGPHNQTIEKRIEDLKKELGDDWEHTHGGPKTEEVIPTPGGYKSCRRPDITFKNKKTGEVYRENVGKVDKCGYPIKREREALDDLDKATGKRPVFTPYNK